MLILNGQVSVIWKIHLCGTPAGCQVNEALMFCFKPGHVLLSQMVNKIFKKLFGK